MEDGTAEFVICLFTIVIIILCISFSFRIKLIDIAKENPPALVRCYIEAGYWELKNDFAMM